LSAPAFKLLQIEHECSVVASCASMEKARDES
jgi:hypothetical protein